MRSGPETQFRKHLEQHLICFQFSCNSPSALRPHALQSSNGTAVCEFGAVRGAQTAFVRIALHLSLRGVDGRVA